MYENYTIIPRRRRQGRFVPNDVFLEKHEYKTVLFLISYGFDIELIRPTYIPKAHNPDLWMLGKTWEMKSPEGKSLKTFDYVFRRARRQAENIILDLRRMKLDNELMLKYLIKLFRKSRQTKCLWVITKNGDLLDILK